MTQPPIPNPATPNMAITVATSAMDVGNAMRADPDLTNAILAAAGMLVQGSGKTLLTSMTFWASIFTPLVAFLVSYYGLHLDGATTGAITTVLTTVAMMVARVVTKQPITGVVTGEPVVAKA